jgi:sporulation related protein
MQSKLAILCAAILISSAAPAQAQSPETETAFTLQVASFPEIILAEGFAAQLERAGEKPGWGTVDLPGRGRWTRVFVGSFKSAEAARLYGNILVERRIIAEYVVKTVYDVRTLSRPRIAASGNLNLLPKDEKPVAAGNKRASGSSISSPSISQSAIQTLNAARIKLNAASGKPSLNVSTGALLRSGITARVAATLPDAAKPGLSLAPPVGQSFTPRSDSARIAFNLIVGSSAQKGGLWVTGDRAEGLNRLRWIAGSENADLISLDESGRVKLNKKLLLRIAKANEISPLEAPLALADYINSNEGLLLLVQLAQGQNRYCLHIGREARTADGMIEVTGSINLDNNYDSRINPYRRSGKKLGKESPPSEFDSLIAINPVALWFNLRTKSLVPVGHITFHELAEAHAKLELRLDYLEHGAQPGAHNTAIIREERLKSQRPFSDVILTLGSNRVLRSEEEIREFYSQGGRSGGNKR